MVLTFTLTARATLGESEHADRDLLIATLGCNLAWGIIDGGMYLMTAILDRAREAREDAAARGVPLERTKLHSDDVKGAIACFWLVFASTFPVAIPFMFMNNAYRALRVSNAILIVMLLLVGVQWGHYANVSKWWSGATFTIVGLILVAVAIALGG